MEGSALDRLVAVPTLAELERSAAELELSPGWIAREQPIFWAEPRSAFRPAHWRYAVVHVALEAAARLVDLSMAERRILALRNPFSGNNFATTRTLSCAYQLMLPGETASTHRHASHALRVMLDARGTYSGVDGVQMPMETGDIVLTPGGCWHGHGHDGDRPAYWVDVLDIPLTHLLEPMFFEPYPGRVQPVRARAETSPHRFSAAEIACRLDTTATDPARLHGARISLPTPDMPSIGIAVERLEAGAATRRQRSTASRCVVVTSGAGHSVVGGTRFEWSRGDTIAVPTWIWYEHHAASDAQLVDISDEPVMRMCHYYRHEAA